MQTAQTGLTVSEASKLMSEQDSLVGVGGHWELLLPLHLLCPLLEWVKGNRQGPLHISFLRLLSGLK